MPEEPRKAARLDLSGFAPKGRAPALDPVQERASIEVGKRLGFDARAPVEKVDGRTLRRKNKSQMNMRLSLQTQNDFKRLVTEFDDADACLSHLIQLYRQSKA
ncbi:hypothetical protein ACELLULO517_27155 [Acidisoma cellulosilytica]|uniref:Uncharacterized protein n=1 Tax=Acidisoma cellulosilyticum TaxID=2802395 RepID=A0A964E6U9_9PROT|nr:hypothetical protein [Acidisoma cellulosilyticum]MCB8883951.1 hypothetical protein [Acidisoma cellulosilyticum]